MKSVKFSTILFNDGDIEKVLQKILVGLLHEIMYSSLFLTLTQVFVHNLDASIDS